ncbi:hypothetical protein ACFFX0_13125 [Citricoccus parietis]|uniref:Uncharacterized protein n=1 Tax=Citricoccus parietis TaxID=592307 RepID=A0ABV5FZJ7_9MICC
MVVPVTAVRSSSASTSSSPTTEGVEITSAPSTKSGQASVDISSSTTWPGSSSRISVAGSVWANQPKGPPTVRSWAEPSRTLPGFSVVHRAVRVPGAKGFQFCS